MKKILFIFLVLAVASELSAQWMPTNGPFGGLANHFAANDEVWFAGTPYGGVFVSDNEGASWQKRNNGFANLGPSGLQVTALYADNEVAYVGIGVNGFYRSMDHGLNWELMSTFWSGYVLNKIARKQETLFVGTAGSGILRSADNGATWASAMNGIQPALVHTVTSMVVKEDLVFVVVNGKLYRSANDGQEWQILFSGLAENTYEVNLCGNVLVALTSQGMYRSTNDGDLWSISNTGIDTQSIISLKSTSNDEEIYVCDAYSSIFYTSQDLGLTWIPLDFPFGNQLYAFQAIGQGRLLFQTNYQNTTSITTEAPGLYFSANAGLNWTNVTHEIDGTFCTSLLAKDNELFCTTSGNGIYKTSDEGENWNSIGIPNWSVRALRNLNGRLFFSETGGVYRSSDGGDTWLLGNQGLATTSISDFVHIDDNYFAATSAGVYMSTDFGESWSSQNSGITSSYVLSLLADGSTLYAGTVGGIFISINYGNSWSSLGNGLPINAGITSIVKYNDNLLVTTGYGIYRLPAGSTDWELVSEGSLVADAHRLKVIDNKIFACRLAPVVNYDGVFVSFDGGNTWEGQSQGLTNNQVWDIEVNGDFVYVATLGSGCFKRNLLEFATSGIAIASDVDLLVYPNPVRDQLTVQVDSKHIGQPVVVYNMIGEIMEQFVTMCGSNWTLDVSAYPSGYYILMNGTSTQRFIVQH